MRHPCEEALVSATLHLVGQSRAFALQLDGARREIASLNDPRAAGLVEAIDQTLRERAGVGTLCHVEQTASELLRTLRAGDG